MAKFILDEERKDVAPIVLRLVRCSNEIQLLACNSRSGFSQVLLAVQENGVVRRAYLHGGASKELGVTVASDRIVIE